MPSIYIELEVPANPTVSETQHKKGLLELVDLDYADSIVAVVTSIEELVNPEADEADYIWKTRWTTASTNTDAFHLPSKLTTLQDGSAGSGEAHIPLRNPWRLRVVGATTGTVNAYISLDQG
jgi:hypothetical protein